jgi:hypothetical protein
VGFEDRLLPDAAQEAGLHRLEAGTLLDEDAVESIESLGIDEVKVRTPLTCDTRYGLCARCYGRDLGRGASAPQGEQPPADRYANPGDGAATSDASTSTAYQPGATGYNPGQTGYAPPGVEPYQVPGQANVVQPTRRNPYYRPGGTGDYVSTGGTGTPAASTADRYASPPSSGDPNAAPPPSNGTIVR